MLIAAVNDQGGFNVQGNPTIASVTAAFAICIVAAASPNTAFAG